MAHLNTNSFQYKTEILQEVINSFKTEAVII